MKKIKITFIGIILLCAFALNFSIFTDTNTYINNANADLPPGILRPEWAYTSFFQEPLEIQWIAFVYGDCYLKTGSNFNGNCPCFA